MIIAATGHRPGKVGGYNEGIYGAPRILRGIAVEFFKETKPDKVISGMALGWDTAVALAALKLHIPLIAAIPFQGQEKKWPVEAQDRYHNILKGAERVHIICPGNYAHWKMHRRNRWMVDNCDKLVALWDGSDGGTEACIEYANLKNRPYINLWEEWVKHEPQRVGRSAFFSR